MNKFSYLDLILRFDFDVLMNKFY